MNKYQRQVPSTTIDIYDILKAWGVTCPATQHAIKKLLQPGERGHKDKLTDLREALASVERAIRMEERSWPECKAQVLFGSINLKPLWWFKWQS